MQDDAFITKTIKKRKNMAPIAHDNKKELPKFFRGVD